MEFVAGVRVLFHPYSVRGLKIWKETSIHEKRPIIETHNKPYEETLKSPINWPRQAHRLCFVMECVAEVRLPLHLYLVSDIYTRKETYKRDLWKTYSIFCDGVRGRSPTTVPPVSSQRPLYMKRDLWKRPIQETNEIFWDGVRGRSPKLFRPYPVRDLCTWKETYKRDLHKKTYQRDGWYVVWWSSWQEYDYCSNRILSTISIHTKRHIKATYKRGLQKRPIKQTYNETYGLFCDVFRGRSTTTVPPVSSEKLLYMKRNIYKRPIKRHRKKLIKESREKYTKRVQIQM